MQGSEIRDLSYGHALELNLRQGGNRLINEPHRHFRAIKKPRGFDWRAIQGHSIPAQYSSFPHVTPNLFQVTVICIWDVRVLDMFTFSRRF